MLVFGLLAVPVDNLMMLLSTVEMGWDRYHYCCSCHDMKPEI